MKWNSNLSVANWNYECKHSVLIIPEHSPYGPSPLGRPSSETRAFLSPPPLLEGPLRLSPLLPGGGGRGILFKHVYYSRFFLTLYFHLNFSLKSIFKITLWKIQALLALVRGYFCLEKAKIWHLILICFPPRKCIIIEYFWSSTWCISF